MNKKHFTLIIFTCTFLLIVVLSIYGLINLCREEITVGLYVGPGTWRDGIEALELLLNNLGIKFQEVRAFDIINGNLYNIKTLIIPGGWAWDYHVTLGSQGENVIKEYVAKGGSIIGICAGAFYLAKIIIWKGKEYTYPLGLLNVIAIGPKKNYPWPSYGLVNIVLEKKFTKYLNSNKSIFSAFYYGGPEFMCLGKEVVVLARYLDNKEPAIVLGTYGKGLVILVGVHLEIREETWPIIDLLIKIANRELSFSFLNKGLSLSYFIHISICTRWKHVLI